MDSNQNQVINVERMEALEAWLTTTQTKITQVNGQRKYGGPPEAWEGPKPGLKCEVFIKHIPRESYEDLLLPLFGSVGPLWEFRLMMNFSGHNRGFAYAKYGSADVAEKAVRELHGRELQPGRRLIVCLSNEKRCLHVTCLPTPADENELLQVLYGMAVGVEGLSLESQPRAKTVSAVVVFSSHQAAAMGKRVLGEAFWKQFGIRVGVHWNSPKRARSEDRLRQRPPRGPPPAPKQGRIPPRASTRSAPRRPPDFCRAVGGPVGARQASAGASVGASVGASAQAASASLQKRCSEMGVGRPTFDFSCGPAWPDGRLPATFVVSISGMGVFRGTMRLCPRPTASGSLAAAREMAAAAILRWMEVKKNHPMRKQLTG
ncbi:dead end protein 1-like [Stigmatopora argus]